MTSRRPERRDRESAVLAKAWFKVFHNWCLAILLVAFHRPRDSGFACYVVCPFGDKERILSPQLLFPFADSTVCPRCENCFGNPCRPQLNGSDGTPTPPALRSFDGVEPRASWSTALKPRDDLSILQTR